MNSPVIVENENFQNAWIEATELLLENDGCLWNLIVHIKEPTLFDRGVNRLVTSFAKSLDLITPKGVAYTIFPHKIYNRVQSAEELYDCYLDTIYPWSRTREHRGWGTYFHRMISYPTATNSINQLKNIIEAINDRHAISRAAYTIIIERPGGETIRPLGAPCLNYIAVQLEPSNRNRKLSLLCTYRNHDFLERAYGNYWGLSNLLCFMANETNSEVGSLTCVSSHAYIPSNKPALRKLLEDLHEIS